MTFHRMTFFIVFFVASATSTAFTGSSPSGLLSVEADTGFPPACTSHAATPARILQAPKMLARPKPGRIRRLMNFMQFNRTLWLMDAMTWCCSRKHLAMDEEYYTAHQHFVETITKLNGNNLLDLKNNLNASSIKNYSLTRIHGALLTPFTKFIEHIISFTDPLRDQAGKLNTLLEHAKNWHQETFFSSATTVITAISDLLKEYNSLIQELDFLAQVTISLDAFNNEQQYAANVAMPQGPAIRLTLEGGAAGG